MALILSARRGWLPKGFTELEYLESSGSQAIDTGIAAGDTIGMKVYAQASRNHDGFVGALYEPWMLIRITGSTNCFFRFGTIQWTWLDHPNEQVPFVTSMNFLNERMAWAESQYKYYSWPFRDGKYEQAEDNLYLFGMNGTTNYAWNGKIFWAKMSDGENIVRDLIPVLDENGTPCMYDKVSHKCFYNIRKGTFGYRIKTTGATSAPMSLRDPYYTAPSGVYARLAGENELDILADTEEPLGEGWEWFANTGEAYEHFGIVQDEEFLTNNNDND